MKRKWILVVVFAVIALVALVVAPLAAAFIGLTPHEPGRTFADGRVITVVDGYVACFLVDVGDGAFVLIDGCNDENAVALSAALKSRGASLSDIRTVLLTHGHGDHIAAVPLLKTATIRSGAPEVACLSGEAAYTGPIPALMGSVDSGVRVTAPLKDGERFDVGNTTFETFLVPGHTAGSVAILAHGVLFLGDSATYKAPALVGAPWVFSDDTDENIAALTALALRLAPRADEVKWIAPAHSGPAAGFAPLGAYLNE